MLASRRQRPFTYFVSGNTMQAPRSQNGQPMGEPGAVVLSIPVREGQFVVPTLVQTVIPEEDQIKELYVGEVVCGQTHVTTYEACPLSTLEVPDMILVNGIFMKFVGTRHVRCFLPPSLGISVNMITLDSPDSSRNRYRTFVIGDEYRGERWLMSVREQCWVEPVSARPLSHLRLVEPPEE
jgi:hypothetical protein